MAKTAPKTGCPCGSPLEKLVILQSRAHRVTGYYRVCMACGLRIVDSEGATPDMLEILQHAFDKRREWPQERIRHDVMRTLRDAYIAATGDKGDEDE